MAMRTPLLETKLLTVTAPVILRAFGMVIAALISTSNLTVMVSELFFLVGCDENSTHYRE